MSRRVLGTAAIVAGVIAAAAVPFVGSASAAACPAWTDAANDATTMQLLPAAANNKNLDIVSASVLTVGGNIVVKVTVADLVDQFTDIGDRFSVQINVDDGPSLRLIADRDAAGKVASVDNLRGAGVGAATGNWDTAANVVTITASQAEFDKAAGSPTKNLPATAVSANTMVRAGADDLYPYDASLPPANTKYAVGAACEAGGGGPAPTGSPTASPTSPTASPTPGGLPAGYPRAGCWTFDDIKGDGKALVPGQSAQRLDNDPDLDLLGVAVNTTETDLKAYVRVDKLAMPKNFGGHTYSLTFKAGAKTVELIAGEGDSAAKAAESQVGPMSYAKVDNVESSAIKVTPTFDKTNNFVVISAPLAQIATATGGAFAAGTQITAVRADSRWMFDPAQDTSSADTAEAAVAADRVYTLGVSPCFAPPAAVLANTGAKTVQFTDAAAIAAKLTDAGGAPLAGKPVTFAIGSKTATVSTGDDGVARTSLNPGVAAGTYSLVTSFAGDATASKVTLTTPFTVVAEKTRLVLTVAKSGTRRTVTAKLLDDDGKPVAGQAVAWYVNGKKVSAPKTNAAGVVTLTTAKPTQTVKAVFAAVAGKYLGSTAQQKV